MASEEAKFTLLLKEHSFEVREYEPHVVAKILVEGDFSHAGRQAFGRLFSYISGNNITQQKIAMTRPVAQTANNEGDDQAKGEGEKIAMTSPVLQQREEQRPHEKGHWRVSFVMPAASRIETLPQPKDPSVSLHLMSAQKMAAIRYSGSWSEQAYRCHRDKLQVWIQAQGYQACGEPIWARYNPPFTLRFLRRNEVLIPITRRHD